MGSRPNQNCKNEKKNLGTSFANVEQCIAAAKVDPTCSGSEVMWSDGYNYAWGCRCCSENPSCPAEESEYYDNNNWDTYTYRECRTIPDYITPNTACKYQAKNLGTSFSSALTGAAAHIRLALRIPHGMELTITLMYMSMRSVEKVKVRYLIFLVCICFACKN